eukprot:TRINITY_DN1664_c0_g1_i1.p1 TRINITY_DN1664_c0_g1~~TRINITY_DN1664_c0_g1_i1.p1  ORF type:complete len:134 (+),score=27.71 TRINITY_DN1664_c0_g1_i1:55-456(+)
MQWAHQTGYGFRRSANLQDASRSSFNLFHDCMRAVPTIKNAFQLEISPREFRARVREEFKKYQKVKDPAVIDRLVFQGKCELMDALNIYHTRVHILRWINKQDEIDNEQAKIYEDEDQESMFVKPRFAFRDEM